MTTPQHRFSAFISYSHKKPDGRYAARLQSALEQLWIPAGVGDPSAPRRRIGRIFRDTTEMGSSSQLSHSISQALSSSAFLVLVGSPQSAESEWVDREVKEFLDHSGAEHVIVVDLDGNPKDCLPATYLEHIARHGEPLRVPGSSATGFSGKVALHDTVLRIIHRLAGCELDELIQRVATRDAKKRRAFLVAASLIVLMLTALSGATIVQRNKAEHARREETAARKAAEDATVRLTYSATSQAIAQRDVPGAARFLKNLPASHNSWIARALHNQLHQAKRVVQAHDARVVAVAASPDGERLATLDQDGKVRVWKRDDLTMISEYAGADPDTRGLAFTQRGDLVAGAPGGSVLRWDSEGAFSQLDFIADFKVIVDGLSPDLRTVIAIFADVQEGVHLAIHRSGLVTSFSNSKSHLLPEAAPQLPASVQSAALRSLPLDPPRVILGLTNGAVATLPLATRGSQHKLLLPGKSSAMVTALWTAADSDLLLVGDINGSVTIFRGEQMLTTFSAHAGVVYAIRGGPGGTFWTVGRDATLACWTERGALCARFLQHTGIIEALALSVGNTKPPCAYSADQQGVLAEWELTRTFAPGYPLRIAARLDDSLNSTRLPISAVGSSSVLLATAYLRENRANGIWVDLQTGGPSVPCDFPFTAPLATIGEDQIVVQRHSETADRLELAVITLKGEVNYKWPLEQGEGITHVTARPGGLACGTSSGHILLVDWNGESKRIRLTYDGTDDLKGVQVSMAPDGLTGVACLMVGATRDSRLHIIDFTSGSIRCVDLGRTVSAHVWNTHGQEVIVALANTGAHNSAGLLAVGQNSDPVPIAFMSLPSTMVISLAVHPREPLLAVGLGDGIIALWSLESAERLVDLGRMNGVPHKLQFSDSGDYLVAEASTGDFRFWTGRRP